MPERVDEDRFDVGATNEMIDTWNSSLAWAVSMVAQAAPPENDLLPMVLIGGGLVLVTLIGGLILRGRGKKR